ncbi:two-component sensor kinase [Bordetella ansorpii]|uniref:Sensor protein n=2 Tax=Bordetella ansorpii TaxID=288768 RepID=A0A157S4Z6_9BORD|nr:heavy metal sensor histidine kinase [Bordetella ansorpii]SAI65474.1 two-component sensor kinase [Bordetella ansorpii]
MRAPDTTPRSLGAQLSSWLAAQTFIVLGIVCIAVYIFANLNLALRQDGLLEQKGEVVAHLVSEHEASGKDARILQHSLTDLFARSSDFYLEIALPGGPPGFGNPFVVAEPLVHHQRSLGMLLPDLSRPGQFMTAKLSMDVSADAKLSTALAWTLFACALGGAIAVSASAAFVVGRGLRPLDTLGRQAKGIAADTMGQRLDGTGQATEVQPLVDEFNSVLQRLELAYIQLESFNMDVAHELRTPLATLVGNIELALSTRQDAKALRDVLASSLEDAQHIAEIVNDMLFLSGADRGAKARRSRVDSVAGALEEVVEYYEALAEEAGVSVLVSGEASAMLDRSLLQRAASNLLSNALRYADRGTVVRIEVLEQPELAVQVINHGDPLPPEHLPLLFHRFYRADESRGDHAEHQGLGLAIVSAIARMHGGKGFCRSEGRLTTIGLTLPGEPVPDGSQDA